MDDLDALDLPELKKLHHAVTKAINSFESRQRVAAFAKVQQIAEARGYKLSDLLDMPPTRKPAAQKYRCPTDFGITWSGRGRRPLWFSEALAGGAVPDDLMI